MDVALLRKVTAQNPYCHPDRWPSVVDNVNAAIKQMCPTTPDIMEHTMKEHISTLLLHHVKENNAQLKKQVLSVSVLCLNEICQQKFDSVHVQVMLVMQVRNR